MGETFLYPLKNVETFEKKQRFNFHILMVCISIKILFIILRTILPPNKYSISAKMMISINSALSFLLKAEEFSEFATSFYKMFPIS